VIGKSIFNYQINILRHATPCVPIENYARQYSWCSRNDASAALDGAGQGDLDDSLGPLAAIPSVQRSALGECEFRVLRPSY
jgi:hypothetical protein